MNAQMREWLSVVAMVGLIGFFYVQTPAGAMAGAYTFPNMLMLLLAGLTLAKAASLLLFKTEETKKEIPEDEKPLWGRFALVVVSLVVYAFAVDHIGFFVSSFVFFFGVSLAVQLNPRTVKCVLIRLAVVLGFLGFCHILFSTVLLMRLPRGILF